MRALCCAMLAAMLAACGGSTEPAGDTSLPPTSADIVGAYDLKSANGTAPPFAAFSTSTDDWTLVADTVSIAESNAWTEATKYFVTNRLDNTTTTQYTVVAGTYLIADGQIKFTMTQGGSTTFAGSVTGNTLTIIFSGKRFVYSK